MFCPQDDPFTCHGTYVVKQSDMDFGSYNGTSNVTSESPNGSLIENSTYHSAALIGAASISIGEMGARVSDTAGCMWYESNFCLQSTT